LAAFDRERDLELAFDLDRELLEPPLELDRELLELAFDLDCELLERVFLPRELPPDLLALLRDPRDLAAAIWRLLPWIARPRDGRQMGVTRSVQSRTRIR
jgi:hypothetical protein